MNARVIRFLFSVIIAGMIAMMLFVAPAPERAAPKSSFSVNSLGDASDDNLGDGICHTAGGVCTLRAAMEQHNSLGGNDQISFSVTGVILLGSQLPFTSGTLTINGPGAGNLTISGNNSVQAFGSANGGATLNLSAVTVANSVNTGSAGGVIYNHGTLNVSGVTFLSNTTTFGGGGAISNDSVLTITGSTLSQNSSSGTSGAIGDTNGTIFISGTNFVSNTAKSGNAGAIFENGGKLTIMNGTFLSNTATTNAGAIENYFGTMTITNTVIGGIYNNGALTLNGSTFSSNSAVTGGGIFNSNNGRLTMNGGSLSYNSATNVTDGGAGIYNAFGTMTITNAAINSNSAGSGGGVHNIGVATLTSVTLSSNTVNWNGGGIFNGSADGANAGIMTLNNSTVSYNSSISGFHLGGGIANSAGTMTLTNTTISGNSVDPTFGSGGYGGGMWNGAVMTLTHVTVSGNSAFHGGGLYQDTSSPAKAITLTNTIIASGSKGENCYVLGTAPIGSKGYNLSSDGSCATYLNQTGDLNNTNPKLGALANNGGSTLTHALLPSSPAIDAIPSGTNGCGTTIIIDQRGAPRPIGLRCDIGAYEASYLFLPLILK